MLACRSRWFTVVLWLLLPVAWPVLGGHNTPPDWQAPPQRLLILASDDGTSHQRVLFALERQIAGSGLRWVRAVADTPEAMELFAGFDCPECLIVSSGVAALRFALEHSRQAALLSIAIPEESFEQIMASRTDASRVSAIYMDLSLRRMISLVQERLPGIQTLGIVSSDGRYLERERARGHVPDSWNGRLYEYHARRQDDMVDTFNQAGREVEAILALPDPVIYNRDTIVRIMLTTYRTGTPLIGYSESMSRAGALMSVFASPEILGEEAGALIVTALGEGRWGRIRRHTERYTVTVNNQVARSLRIRINGTPR